MKTTRLQKSPEPVQIVMRRVDSLSPYERNPRKNDAVVDRMVASIKEFGFKIPVLAKSNGEVIDGHLRLKAAQKLGINSVPVIPCDDWTEAQVKAFRLLVNRSVTWASWDDDLVRLELEDIRKLGMDLGLTGFDPDEIQAYLAPQGTQGLTDDDAAPPVADRPVSLTGDVWDLGPHRLVCGDATVEDDVTNLMGTDRADMVFIDPPYNVAYSGRGKVNRLGPIDNDDMFDCAFDAFIGKVLASCHRVMRDLSPIYVCHPDSKSAPKITFETCFAKHFHKGSTIIWFKQSAGMGWQDYRAQHEPILYGWKKGDGSHYFIEDRSKTTVWEIGRDAQATYAHPTQKPVALAAEAIGNSTKSGDIVVDLCAGSGSTLIACEKLSRSGRVMEIDPKYVDVIIRRWQTFTGNMATLKGSRVSFDLVEEGRHAVTSTKRH